MENLLEIKNFSVSYPRSGGSFRALDAIELSVQNGESVGIVGESGSGKSTIALGVLGLLPLLGAKTTGDILFRGKSVPHLSRDELRKMRGEKISLVFQNPWMSLDPLYNIENQFTEFLKAHQHVHSADINEIISRSLVRTQLPSDNKFRTLYPHQLSGGMLQRVSIAMATALHPELLIADEPTSSLDVTTQTEIISLLKHLRFEQKMSLVFISHDLVLVSQLCDRIYILKDGHIIESGTTENIFLRPQNPYTKKLIAAIPQIEIKGYNPQR